MPPYSLKYLSLATLTVQGSAFALVLRYSRTQVGPKYLASTSVLLTELSKFILCIIIAAYSETDGFRSASVTGARRRVYEIVANCLPMAIPATLYVIQQTLLIVGASHLDAVSFQICVNLKVVPTALFAVTMLGKNLNLQQWLSLPTMAIGVAFVTIANHQQTVALHAAAHAAKAAGGAEEEIEDSEVWLVGIIACLVAGVMSGYASVYFEKNIKVRDSQTTLWVKNIQLGIFGVSLAVISVFTQDWVIMQSSGLGGLMQGFGGTAWAVVGLQAAGGLLVAAVVKYADNILKGFANAVSVILSWLVSIPLFGLFPTPLFLFGLGLVLLSMWMYNADSRLLRSWSQPQLRARARASADGGEGEEEEDEDVDEAKGHGGPSNAVVVGVVLAVIVAVLVAVFVFAPRLKRQTGVVGEIGIHRHGGPVSGVKLMGGSSQKRGDRVKAKVREAQGKRGSRGLGGGGRGGAGGAAGLAGDRRERRTERRSTVGRGVGGGGGPGRAGGGRQQ